MAYKRRNTVFNGMLDMIRQQNEYEAKLTDFQQRYPGVIRARVHDSIEFNSRELAIRLVMDVMEPTGTFHAEMRALLRGYGDEVGADEVPDKVDFYV